MKFIYSEKNYNVNVKRYLKFFKCLFILLNIPSLASQFYM